MEIKACYLTSNSRLHLLLKAYLIQECGGELQHSCSSERPPTMNSRVLSCVSGSHL